MANALKLVSGHITLYASARDKAIKLSRKFHKNKRAGEPMLVVPGITCIDASEMKTDFLAHSYFGDSWPLLSDIHSILTADTPAAKRFGLKKTVTTEGVYYVFRP